LILLPAGFDIIIQSTDTKVKCPSIQPINFGKNNLAMKKIFEVHREGKGYSKGEGYKTCLF